MFCVLQIPLVDSRPFLNEATNKLSRPTWPIAEAGREFIRQFGVVHTRKLGGVRDYAGEESYCRSTRAIRLVNQFGTVTETQQKNRTRSHRCIFRRLFVEGRGVVKFEIGFSELNEDSSFRNTPKAFLNTVKAIGTAPVIIGPRKQSNRLTTYLANAGDAISQLYLDSTTQKGIAESSVEDWWVSPAEPVLLLEFPLLPYQRFPKLSTKVPLGIPGASLHFQRVMILGTTLNVWYLGIDPSFPSFQFRELRLHLLRFHSEFQNLRTILRWVSQGKIAIVKDAEPTNELQQYLLDANRLISRHKKYGVPQSPLLSTIKNSVDFVSAGERTSLLQKLKSVRGNILNSIEGTTKTGDDHQQPIVVLGNLNFSEAIEIKEKGSTVTKYNIKLGDNAVFHGDFVVADSIQDSFNKLQESTISDNLKCELDKLVREVTELSKSQGKQDSRQTAEDLNTFVKETVKPKPRLKWCELSAEGLMDAASSAGALGVSISSIVKNVLDLLKP